MNYFHLPLGPFINEFRLLPYLLFPSLWKRDTTFGTRVPRACVSFQQSGLIGESNFVLLCSAVSIRSWLRINASPTVNYETWEREIYIQNGRYEILESINKHRYFRWCSDIILWEIISLLGSLWKREKRCNNISHDRSTNHLGSLPFFPSRGQGKYYFFASSIWWWNCKFTRNLGGGEKNRREACARMRGLGCFTQPVCGRCASILRE